MRMLKCPDIPVGYCHCGCGEKTPIAKKPKRFIRGHSQRVQAAPIIPRLEAKTQVDENGCWIWSGTIGKHGYGQISYAWRGRRTWNVYRLAYELLVGPVPEGLVLDHLCRVPGCINPEHLEPVTHGENVRRGLAGRLVTHCPRGHEYTPENTYIPPTPGKQWRVCRTCQREVYGPRQAAKRRAA